MDRPNMPTMSFGDLLRRLGRPGSVSRRFAFSPPVDDSRCSLCAILSMTSDLPTHGIRDRRIQAVVATPI